MPMLDLSVDEEGAWSDLEALGDRLILCLEPHSRLGLASLSKGTHAGKPVVMIRIPLPDGRVVVTQTTLALLVTAVEAFVAVHGDPRTGASS